jgi:phosphosulfolactate synthase (CoM biosynthesis protein A)
MPHVDRLAAPCQAVQKAGLKAKPEVGIQFGAGGASTVEAQEPEGTLDPEWAISQAKRFLEAGAYMTMIEFEGITESVDVWRTDVPAKIANVGHREGHVRSVGFRGLCVVHQELWPGCEPVRGSQPDRPA